jgi:hypothetical protein
MKKRIIILGSVVLAIVVLWSVAWFVLAGMIRQNIEAQALTDGVTQPRLTCAGLGVGGFPFRFDADCQTAEITMGDVVVDVPGIRASIRVYAPTHLLASALGPLQLTDSFTGTRNQIAWSGLEASVRLSDWRIARASVSVKDLVWSDTLMGETLIAQSSLAEIHLLDIPEQHDPARGLAALAVYAPISNISYPGMTLTDTNAEVQLELTGLPDDVRTWGDTALLPFIQQAGGALKIVSIHGTDADSVLDASGELKLDPQGMLDGSIAITSVGVAERLGPMLAEPWRTLVFGTAAADGSFSNQLNFRGGGVFSGLVPIASVPPLF